MLAVFYDRKNKREVKSNQLVPINYVERYLVVDSEEFDHGPWIQPERYPAYIKEHKIGTLGYKSENCRPSQNWDLHLKEEDLVFLRMENEPHDDSNK